MKSLIHKLLSLITKTQIRGLDAFSMVILESVDDIEHLQTSRRQKKQQIMRLEELEFGYKSKGNKIVDEFCI